MHSLLDKVKIEQLEHLLATMQVNMKALKEELELEKDERTKAIRTLEEVCVYNPTCSVSRLVYGSTTKGDVVQRSDCILVYWSTTKGDVVKRSDCILVYGNTTKGGVVKRSDCILVYMGALPRVML